MEQYLKKTYQFTKNTSDLKELEDVEYDLKTIILLIQVHKDELKHLLKKRETLINKILNKKLNYNLSVYDSVIFDPHAKKLYVYGKTKNDTNNLLSE